MTPLRRLLWATFLLGLAGALPLQARADDDYLLQPGDLVELSVVGVPQLQHRSPVGLNGMVNLPLIDDIAASGRTIAAVRDDVRAKLSKKVAPRQNGDGVTDVVAFAPEQIGLAIAEYRPVYLTGNLQQSGEQRYRIGLTVREAVALAGGLEFGEQGSKDTLVVLNDLASAQARLYRLEAERQQLASLSNTPTETSVGLIPPRGAALDLASSQISLNTSVRSNETEYLEQSIETTERYLDILRRRRVSEAEGLEADKADLDRLADLFKKGITVAGRVSDARRTVLLSATQVLQTDAAIASAEREILGFRRQIKRLGEQASLATLSDIEEARLKVQNLQARLMSDQPPSSATSGGAAEDQAVIAITRSAEGRATKLDATLDTPLRPGDVVSVTLPGVIPGRSRALRKD